MQTKERKIKKIAILSTCVDDWGGSEELWGRSVPYLQKMGFDFLVFKPKVNLNHPEIAALVNKGVIFKELDTIHKQQPTSISSLLSGIKSKFRKMENDGSESAFYTALKLFKPDFVIISQGINFDALHHAYHCISLNTPYVIVSQKAVDWHWPWFEDRVYMIEALQKARKCFFVSRHNLRLTEEQFGTRLPNSQVIFNPVKVSGKVVPYPSTEDGYKLACVGRLFLLDKGQDILIRILANPRWRERPLTISFIGTGSDYEGLKAMAKLLNVSNVVFMGHIHDIENLWKDYHCLILPSRSEGLPLSMVEAMAAGRPVIVSTAGGNAELVEEGVTGFIGHANEDSFEEAMERAWEARENWEEMGKRASVHISTSIPPSPENEFAKYINQIINE